MYKYSKSKKMAWFLVIITTLLTVYSIYKSMEGIGVAIWSTGIPSAVGLYINKQYQLRKEKEIRNEKKYSNNMYNIIILSLIIILFGCKSTNTLSKDTIDDKSKIEINNGYSKSDSISTNLDISSILKSYFKNDINLSIYEWDNFLIKTDDGKDSIISIIKTEIKFIDTSIKEDSLIENTSLNQTNITIENDSIITSIEKDINTKTKIKVKESNNIKYYFYIGLLAFIVGCLIAFKFRP